MDENVFRIVVTVAVALASLAFLVQAGIVFALYKVTRKAQGDVEKLIERVNPLIVKAGPVIDKAGELIKNAGPVLDRVGPAIDEALPAIRKAGPVMDETRDLIAQAGQLMERVNEAATTANLVLDEARPHVAKIGREAAEIARVGREQVEHLGDLVNDAGEKARARLEQIDHGVESAIEQVGNVGGAVKRAAVKPVREINGLAAGITAAFATLMHQKKSRVDSATQDEEMFI